MPLLNKLLIAVAGSVIVLIGYVLVSGHKAADFSLKNWDNETITMRELRGNVVVQTFSYSNCSVRCPVVTVRLKSLDEVMNAPDDVVYLHISIDPAKDTPASMKKYFGLYKLDVEKDRRWIFVSGQQSELSRLWKFYGIDIEKKEEKMLPEGYYIEYTPKLVLIDRDGVIRHEADFFFLEDEIAAKIKEMT